MAAFQGAAATTARAQARRRWAVFVGLAAAVVVLDQLTKWWVAGAFEPAWNSTPVAGFAAPTPILGDLVRVALSHNSGGLFGLFGSSALPLAAASIVVMALIVTLQARSGLDGPWLLTLTLGLLLGGALGNLIDRLRLGYVIDFLDMGLGSWRWYTFNVADAAISAAIVGLLALSLFGERLEGGPHERAGGR